jgi:two-component system OmpR family sensor kinase
MRQGWQPSRLLGNMRVRILAVVALLLAGSLLVSVLLLRNVLRDRLDEEVTLAMAREVEEFRLLTTGTNPRTGEPFGDDLEAMFDVYFAREVPDEGETLIAFVGDELHLTEAAADALPASALTDLVEGWLAAEDDEYGEATVDEGEVRYSVVPIDVGRRGAFVVANHPLPEQQEIDRSVLTEAVIQLITVAIAIAIAFAFSGRVLRPLRSLAETARTISETDFTRRIPVSGTDEASQIADAFNDMLARLEAAFTTQRKFLDEASHELRAPLTVIRGHLELMELDDPHEREATAAVIIAEIDRMNRMVEDLLTLARAEHPDFLEPGPLDVAEWTQAAFQRSSVLCARTWHLDACADGQAVADAQRLTQAVMQLSENICHHTPEGTSARLGTEITRGRLRIWVEDDGPGISDEDRGAVFENFRRAKAGHRGTGLGLPIVRAIAEAHGGSVRVVPAQPRGARFEIEVPLVMRPVAPADSGRAQRGDDREELRKREGLDQVAVDAE